jgi:hypothetical protein
LHQRSVEERFAGFKSKNRRRAHQSIRTPFFTQNPSEPVKASFKRRRINATGPARWFNGFCTTASLDTVAVGSGLNNPESQFVPISED